MVYTKKQLDQIKKAFIKLLKANKSYQPETDDWYIDQFLFNIELIEKYKDNIIERGAMIQLGKNENFQQINFAHSGYINAIKTCTTILKELGLEKAKIEADEKDSALTSLKALLN